jgi:FkbM family methyltransferase
LFSIASLLPPLPRIKIVDVGAAIYGELPYALLLQAVPCDVVGFEPVTEECEKLNRNSKDGHRFLPYCVGDGSKRTFHECNVKLTSSLFEPNTALIERFQTLAEVTQVVKSYPVETVRLDDVPEVDGIDYLKLDVQGAELMVLQGAEQALADVLAIHTEVEFLPLYKEQPLFADIDSFLRNKGFQFHRLMWAGRTFKPLMVNNDPNVIMSQVLWGEAIYVRDFMQFDQLAPMALLKLATILHENYRAYDLAAVSLEAYDRQAGTRLQPTYLQRLVGQA